jgi:hypothetical protein
VKSSSETPVGTISIVAEIRKVQCYMKNPTQADAKKKMTIIDNAKSRHLDQVQYCTVVGETWSSETLQKCG